MVVFSPNPIHYKNNGRLLGLMSMFPSYNYTLVILFVLKELVLMELSFCSTSDFCPLDSVSCLWDEWSWL